MDVEGYTRPGARTARRRTDADGRRPAVVRGAADGRRRAELGAMSYVDAENGALLVRDGIIDYASDNPAWKVFPASPPLDYSSTDTRELWCWNIAASAGCQKAVANPASPQPWDVDAATGLPTFQTSGNNARATEKWNIERRQRPGRQLLVLVTRDYVYPWTNQWLTAALQPGRVHVAAAERHRRCPGEPARDAQPHARLVVPPRLHRDDVQRAGVQLRPRRRARAIPSTATPRPAASSAGRRASPRATTPTSSRRPTGSCR